MGWNRRRRVLCEQIFVAGRSKLDSLERAKLDSCDRGIGR